MLLASKLRVLLRCVRCAGIGLQIAGVSAAGESEQVRVTSSEHEQSSRSKRDVDENSAMNDGDDEERSKRLPRLGARALPRLGLLRSVNKRLPRLGRQRRLWMLLFTQTGETVSSPRCTRR